MIIFIVNTTFITKSIQLVKNDRLNAKICNKEMFFATV